MKKDQLFSRERREKRVSFYKTSAWRRLRQVQLSKTPLCEMCERKGRFTVANTCDHISPIWDTWEEFVRGPFQSLCSSCHKDKTISVDMPKLIKAEKLKLEVWDV